MKLRKYALMACLTVIALSVLTGCAGLGNNDNDVTPQNQVGQGDPNIQRQNAEGPALDNGLMNGNGNNNEGILGINNNRPDMSGIPGRQMGNNVAPNAANDRQQSQLIERELEKLREVNNCSVVKNGDKVVVGLDPIRTFGNRQDIIRRIEQRVKELDPSVRDVAVTDSGNLLTQIRQMSNELMKGSNVDIAARLNQLIQQIRR